MSNLKQAMHEDHEHLNSKTWDVYNILSIYSDTAEKNEQNE